MIHIYFILRAAVGLLIVGAAFMGLYNVVRTIRGEQPQGGHVFAEEFQGGAQ